MTRFRTLPPGARVAPGSPQPGGMTRLRALGRLPVGSMNKTEAAYDLHLEQRERAGEIVWRKFEGMKFRLADNTFYSPDFAVLLADGAMEMHEIKGAPGIFQDDAKVKVKVAATLYPFRFFVVYPRPKKDGGGWRMEAVGS